MTSPGSDALNDWHLEAQCLGEAPECYDPDNIAGYGDGPGSEMDRNSAAARLCQGCPVIQQCAQEAIQQNASATIRGGAVIGPASAREDRFDRLYYAMKHGRPPSRAELKIFRDNGFDRWIKPDPERWTTSPPAPGKAVARATAAVRDYAYMPAAELAEILGCSERTVLRYRKKIKEAAA